MTRGSPRARYLVLLFVFLAFILFPVLTSAQGTAQMNINYVEAIPIEEDCVYEVRAYVTITGEDSAPIADLPKESFEVRQDAQKATIEDIATAVDSIHFFLVLDLSGSMASKNGGKETKLESMKKAVADFITQGRKPADPITIILFGTKVCILKSGKTADGKYEIDSTIDGGAAISAVNKLQPAECGEYTCLWDAAYMAVEKAIAIPRGRREVIVFTDGRDAGDDTETKPCSVKTLDDVINLARDTGVPVFTIGLGTEEKINVKDLQRLSELTGGRSLVTKDATQLSKLFEAIAEQLRKQYVIRYKTVATPGQHRVTVNVMLEEGLSLSGQKAFVLPPAPPPKVRIASPESKATIRESPLTVVAEVTCPNNASRVEIAIDNEKKGEIVAPIPISNTLKVDIGGLSEGLHPLTAIVYDDKGKEADRDTIEIVVILTPTPTSTATATPTSTPTAAGEEAIITVTPPPTETPSLCEKMIGSKPLCKLLPVFAGISAMLLVGVFLILRRKRPPAAEQKPITFELPPEEEEEVTQDLEEVTMDVLEAPPVDVTKPVAVLRVIRSPGLTAGKEFELYARSSTIGRRAEKDIYFSDQAVSRDHAEIRYEEGRFMLYEPRSTTYGTFVSERRIPTGATGGVELRNGDRIRFGRHTEVEFVQKQGLGKPTDEKTRDIDEETKDSTENQSKGGAR